MTLAARLATLSTERLVALVRANAPGLSAEAEALEAAAMYELAGRLTTDEFQALCDRLS